MPFSRSGLYHELHGSPDAPFLVLSSGLGGSANYWAPNLAVLSEAYRVVVYDHRGTGRSDRSVPDGFTVNHMADDLLELLAELGTPRAHVMGHAAGTVAGLAMALKAPESIQSLVAVNGWSRADPHFLRCFETRLALLHGSGLMAFLRAQPVYLYPANWISANLDWLDAEAEHQRKNFPGNATTEARIAALAAFDVHDRLSDIACPVLALCAADDMLVPSKSSQALAAGLRHGTLVEMDRGGHACNVTQADRFNQIVLDWLTGQQFSQE